MPTDSQSSQPDQEALAVGVDFGGTTVKIGVCRGQDVIDKAEPIETDSYTTALQLIDAIEVVVNGLREKHPGIMALGVGVPGFVDCNSGMVHKLTNVQGWEKIPLKKILSERFGFNIQVENDANAMAYAEFRLGAGRGATNMLAITLGTGVGGGLIINGKLYHGSSSGAGEVGQMSIDYKGPPGVYTNKGCLEDYIGNKHVTQLAMDLYREAGVTKSEDDCEPVHLAAAAGEGDEVALTVWNRFAEMLACELNNVIWLINPDTIVVGGGMSKAGSILFDPLKEFMKSPAPRDLLERGKGSSRPVRERGRHHRKRRPGGGSGIGSPQK